MSPFASFFTSSFISDFTWRWEVGFAMKEFVEFAHVVSLREIVWQAGYSPIM
jgi:hypothetical protein